MTKECDGKMLVLAALLIALGMVGCSYILSTVDYAPKVDVSDITSTPNIYVSSQAPEHAISASGEASRSVEPDLLLIGLRVQTESKNAKDSQEENAEVMADLLESLKALGLEDADIQTTGYRVDPIYDSEYVCDGKCHYETELIGYRTTHMLRLDVEELDEGGELVDEAAKAGTNQTFVDYIQFTLKDGTREALETELLEEASGAAKARAQSIAKGLGASLGKPLAASEGYSYTPYYRSYDAFGYAEAAAAPPTELSAGEVQVTVTVNVQYEIA